MYTYTNILYIYIYIYLQRRSRKKRRTISSFLLEVRPLLGDGRNLHADLGSCQKGRKDQNYGVDIYPYMDTSIPPVDINMKYG